MEKRIGNAVLTLALSLAAPLAMACSTEIEEGPGSCGYQPPGSGGSTPVYVLQGVIENQGYESDNGPGGGKRVKIRAYSRFANASNDRVDADYINVRCNAYDQIGNGYTTEYDSENGGALVDVHFASNFVYGIYRTITVVCAHHATFGVNTYDTTSNAQFTIPN